MQLIAISDTQLLAEEIELSKSERTKAGLNVADWAADFSNDFWPPVRLWRLVPGWLSGIARHRRKDSALQQIYADSATDGCSFLDGAAKRYAK